jgi:hypothetical protein
LEFFPLTRSPSACRQLDELYRHRRVASNRLSSAVWYGILAGCEPAVYGDPMQLEGEDPTFGGQARIRRQWAGLHGEQIAPEPAYAAAVAELGADRLLPPAEMRRLFRWIGETTQGDTGQWEATQRLAGQSEAAQREAQRREATQREAQRREAGQGEAAQREAGQREARQRASRWQAVRRDSRQGEVRQ